MKTVLIALLMVLMVVASAQADVILAPGSTWEYTFTDPTGDPSWNTTTGGWATGTAPFGNNIGGGWDPLFNYNTYWPADGSDGYDLWVRTLVNLAGYDLSTVMWNLGVDNGFQLFMNGSSIAAHNAEGYTYRWEYNGSVTNAVSGMNVVAVALEDHGGLTAFDMQITGTRSVPEPSSLMLLGAGLAGLPFLRRRRES